MNTLVDDIKLFLATNELKSVAIYNAIDKVCTRYSSEKTSNMLLVEQAVDTFLTDKLISDGGFKTIANKCLSDNEVIRTMHFLLNQHYHSLIQDKNPQINGLKRDVDNILTQLPNVFISEDSAKHFYKNRFIKSNKFDIKDFEQYKFAKYDKINERLKKIFIVVWEHLNINIYTDYSDIIQNLKHLLGISETSTSELYGDEQYYENIELENEENVDSIYNTNEDYHFEDENFIQISEDDKLFSIIEEYLKLLTERQIRILIILIKEKTKNNSISDYKIFQLYKNTLQLGKQTFYNELDVIKNKRNLIFNKYMLDETERLEFVKQLVGFVNEEEN